jgi:hypothetical protein
VQDGTNDADGVVLSPERSGSSLNLTVLVIKGDGEVIGGSSLYDMWATNKACLLKHKAQS